MTPLGRGEQLIDSTGAPKRHLGMPWSESAYMKPSHDLNEIVDGRAKYRGLLEDFTGCDGGRESQRRDRPAERFRRKNSSDIGVMSSWDRR